MTCIILYEIEMSRFLNNMLLSALFKNPFHPGSRLHDRASYRRKSRLCDACDYDGNDNDVEWLAYNVQNDCLAEVCKFHAAKTGDKILDNMWSTTCGPFGGYIALKKIDYELPDVK